MSLLGRRLAYTSLALGAAGGGFLYRRYKRSEVPEGTKYYVTPGQSPGAPGAPGEAPYLPPSREAMINKMKQERFDVLIIGGGASGAGVLFDASARGLKCCLVEKSDFACGTSSKSTKLLHGGIRYLQKAFEELDLAQLSLVCEALEERAHILSCAPHLAQPLGILMPIYKYYQIPYFWTGIKTYAFIAELVCFWNTRVPPTSYLPAATTRFALPLLPAGGLKGSLLYFDGQMNDSRLCLALALSPTIPGFVEGMKEAAAANYVQVKELIKDEHGQIIGVKAEDRETNEEFPIYAKVVVNCTGYLADSVRKMANENATPLVEPAAGAHIVLPHWYTHFTPFGLLLPETSDGRVLFLLPWEGQTLAGTTDAPALGSGDPRAKASDVDFLVDELASYLGVDPVQMKSDIQSVWCGHRPLVSQSPVSKDTAGIVRSHTVLVDEASGLVSLLGGKWTTYRRMAEDTVDTLLKTHKDKVAASSRCRTSKMKVQGAVDPLHLLDPRECCFSSGSLEHELALSFPSLSFDQRKHLIKSYGFLSRDVLKLTKTDEELMQPLLPGLPYLKAEVVFACKYEQARTISDFLARRIPLFFLNQKEGLKAIDTVCSIMARELGWSVQTAKNKKEEAIKYAETFTVSP